MLRFALVIAVVAILIFLLSRMISGSRSAIPGVGTIAPDFILASQENQAVHLNDYRGRWVVLYFYPRDLTPGCTQEAHNFQIDQPKYAARHAVVMGVSVNSVESHRKFCEKEGLNFKLLADPGGKVSKAYGSLTDFGVARFAARHTFIIDPAGKIAKLYPVVDPSRHSGEVLSALDLLQKP